jgi:hypothetical protein
MGIGVALVLSFTKSLGETFVPSPACSLILLGLASVKMLEAAVSDDESGADDDSDRDASDSAAGLRMGQQSHSRLRMRKV